MRIPPVTSQRHALRPTALAAAFGAVLAFGLATTAAAATRTITFDEAVTIALRQNVTLRQTLNGEASSAIGARDEQMGFLPNLSVSSQGSRQYGRYFSQEEARMISQTTRSLSLGLSSSMTLFDGFGNVASLRQASLTRKASGSEVERARQTVVYDVIQAYLTLIAQQQQVEVKRNDLAAQELQEQQVDFYVRAGKRTIGDLYTQQAATATARLVLLQAQRDYEVGQVGLIRTLQLDPRGDYAFVAPVASDSVPPESAYELQDLFDRAFAQRADLRAAEARLAASRQGVRAAQARFWPTLSLSGSYGSSYNSTADGSISDQFDNRRSGSVGLSVSLPVFDRLSSYDQMKQAQIQQDNARLDLEDMRQEVALEVRRAHLDYRTAYATLHEARASLRAATQALEAVTERYRAGSATMLELTQARATQVQAASTEISAHYAALLQQKLLDYYLGSLSPATPLLD
jgi:outer membrane protein